MRAWLNTNTDDIMGVFYGEGAWLTTGGGQIDNGKVMGGVSTLVPTHAHIQQRRQRQYRVPVTSLTVCNVKGHVTLQ